MKPMWRDGEKLALPAGTARDCCL